MSPTQPTKIPKLNSVGYASGNFAKSLIISTIDIAYLYFLVEFIGISPWLAGTILLISLVWDGFTDPIFGYMTDKWISKFLSYRKLIVIGTPLCALSFVMIFFIPLNTSFHTTFWVMLSSLIFRSCFTLVEVPHNSLLASMSLDSRERNTLSTLRFMFSSLGGMALAFVIAPILEKTAADVDSYSLLSFSIYIAVMFGVVMLISVSMSKPSILPVTGTANTEQAKVSNALADIWDTPQLRQILVIVFLSAACITVFSKMTIFYAKFVLEDPSLAPNLINAHLLGQLLCLPFWLYLSRIAEKRTVGIMAHASMICLVLVFFIFAPETPWVAYCFFFLAGLSLSGLTTMNWSIVPDTIDYTEKNKGHRHEALTFGILLLINKVANGISIAVVGWSLDLIKSSEAISDSFGAFLIMSLIPLLGTTFSIIILLQLKLSYQEHEELVSGKY